MTPKANKPIMILEVEIREGEPERNPGTTETSEYTSRRLKHD